ncbi:MAG: diguanylate cyclase [Silanimonas sp.]
MPIPAPLSRSSARPSLPLAGWAWLLAGVIAYYVAAKAGTGLFSLQPSNFTLLWLPCGIALVMCRHFGARALPFVMLAAILANVPGMAHPEPLRYALHAFLGAAADTFAAGVGWLLLRRALPDGLQAPADLFRFVAWVALPSMLLGAVALTVNMVAGSYLPEAAAWSFVGMLVLADTLGLLLVYPLYDAWQRQDRPRFAEWRDWWLLTMVAVGLCVLAFRQHPGVIFLVIPTLIFVLFRSREHLVLLALLLTVTLIVALTARDFGPFGIGDAEQNRVMVLSYLFTTTVIVLALLLQERRIRQAGADRDRWRFHAQHDALTGLPNRASIETALRQALEHARHGGLGFCVAIIDIDHFKRVNDTHGHHAGDEVLRVLAERLRDGLRPLDRVGRFGGEEFVLLLPDLEVGAAAAIVERLRDAMASAPIALPSATIAVTISAGLVHSPPGAAHSLEALLKEADRRLYSAKHSGRNRVAAA